MPDFMFDVDDESKFLFSNGWSQNIEGNWLKEGFIVDKEMALVIVSKKSISIYRNTEVN